MSPSLTRLPLGNNYFSAEKVPRKAPKPFETLKLHTFHARLPSGCVGCFQTIDCGFQAKMRRTE
jgi:hypothetical protein